MPMPNPAFISRRRWWGAAWLAAMSWPALAKDKPAHAGAASGAAAAPSAAAVSSSPAAKPPGDPPPLAKLAPVDINQADKAALLKLPGIDRERADAIVRGRPYGSTDELVARRIISPAAYARIRPHVVAGKPAGTPP